MIRGPHLVLTGTSASGKTTVARTLAKIDKSLVVVKAVTTRSRRDDDYQGQYEYVTDQAFEELQQRDQLVISTEYRDQRYGIRRRDVRSVCVADGLPILVVAPNCVQQLLTSYLRSPATPAPVSVFLDADDDELDSRLASRGDAADAGQRCEDRSFSRHCVYRLTNHATEPTARAIMRIWSEFNSGGLVADETIKALISCDVLLSDAVEDNVESASYDLRLGDEYFAKGRIRRLGDTRPILLIEPYDYAIVTSHERADMPLDIAARFDLSVGMFSQGIVLSNGPQVDPGFRGRLFCLLFNTSSSPVMIKRRQHYATIEFHRLASASSGYAGPRQEKGDIASYLPENATTGAINELKMELEQLRRESVRLQSFILAALSLILAVAALFISSLN